MNSDRLSRAHEQKYWDGAMVRDLTDFSMMLWKLVSPSLPGAGVPSPLCAVRPAVRSWPRSPGRASLFLSSAVGLVL